MKTNNASAINGMEMKKNYNNSLSLVHKSREDTATFTVAEIKKWLSVQRSLGDARYNLNAEKIIEAGTDAYHWRDDYYK